VRDGDRVVVYDDWNRAGSARAWWVLTAAGVDNVRILDGGLAAWLSAGGALEPGAAVPRPGDLTVSHQDLYDGALPTVTADQAMSVGTLIDARAPERFRGDVEPIDPVAGHIPGARNVPSTALLTGEGTFLDDEQLARRFGGVTGAAGAYCGSGVTASVVVAALASLGVDTALYPGSWSEWSSDETRPVEKG
ncbi:MAG: sulfurtransferase, partial [Mycobacterium sp.]